MTESPLAIIRHRETEMTRRLAAAQETAVTRIARLEYIMSELDKENFVDNCVKKGPQAAMEKALIEAYLKAKGYSLKDLQTLPPEQAKALMVEACEYASLRLAQVESSAHFRDKIQGPS